MTENSRCVTTLPRKNYHFARYSEKPQNSFYNHQLFHLFGLLSLFVSNLRLFCTTYGWVPKRFGKTFIISLTYCIRLTLFQFLPSLIFASVQYSMASPRHLLFVLILALFARTGAQRRATDSTQHFRSWNRIFSICKSFQFTDGAALTYWEQHTRCIH